MWTLIKKESLENILTLRFVVGFLACNILFGISTFVLVQDFNAELERARTAQLESEKEAEQWTVFSFVRPDIVRVPTTLSVFGANSGAKWGNSFEISHIAIPVFAEDMTTDGDFLAFYSGFDFTAVIQIFVSLLAMLFTFDSFSGEKERGSLRMILANGVGRARLLAAKFIGALVALAPVVISGFIVSILIYLYFGSVGLSGEEWIGLTFIFLVTLLYGAVFVAIGLLISSFTHRSAASLVIGMVVWIAWILIIPSAVGLFSQQLGDEKDLKELNANLQDLRMDYNRRASKIYRPLFARGLGSDYLYVGNWSGYRNGFRCRVIGKNGIRRITEILPPLISVERELASKRYAMENECFQRRMEKIELMRSLRRLSPSSVLAHSVGAFANTGTSSQVRFIEQARRYREEIINYIEGRGGYTSARWFTDEPEHTGYEDFVAFMETLTESDKFDHYRSMLATEDGRAKLNEIFSSLAEDPRRKLDLHDMPRFKASRGSIVDSLAAAQLDLLILTIYLAVALGVAFVRFLNYDVR